MWKKRLQIALWCLLGCACLVLLVAAMQLKDRKTCTEVKIDIDDAGENVFVDTTDIAAILHKNRAVVGEVVENIPLGLVEKELEKNAWVKDAQLFFDNNRLLTVKITERQPVARVFTVQGKSFYIDSAANILPLSDRHTARIPVFTSFPVNKDSAGVKDSAVLQDVKHIAQYIQQDSFWMAQVAQVDITPKHTYELIPVLGNQVINLGTADELETKFKKLFAFYQQVWSKTGFEKYERVDLQYEGQVVAVRRGEALPLLDSAAALATGATALADSVHTVLVPPVHAAVRDTVAHPPRDVHATPARQARRNTNPPKPQPRGRKPARAVMPGRHH